MIKQNQSPLQFNYGRLPGFTNLSLIHATADSSALPHDSLYTETAQFVQRTQSAASCRQSKPSASPGPIISKPNSPPLRDALKPGAAERYSRVAPSLDTEGMEGPLRGSTPLTAKASYLSNIMTPQSQEVMKMSQEAPQRPSSYMKKELEFLQSKISGLEKRLTHNYSLTTSLLRNASSRSPAPTEAPSSIVSVPIQKVPLGEIRSARPQVQRRNNFHNFYPQIRNERQEHPADSLYESKMAQSYIDQPSHLEERVKVEEIVENTEDKENSRNKNNFLRRSHSSNNMKPKSRLQTHRSTLSHNLKKEEKKSTAPPQTAGELKLLRSQNVGLRKKLKGREEMVGRLEREVEELKQAYEVSEGVRRQQKQLIKDLTQQLEQLERQNKGLMKSEQELRKQLQNQQKYQATPSSIPVTCTPDNDLQYYNFYPQYSPLSGRERGIPPFQLKEGATTKRRVVKSVSSKGQKRKKGAQTSRGKNK